MKTLAIASLLLALAVVGQGLLAVPMKARPSNKLFHGNPNKLQAWGINSSINNTIPLGGNLTYFAEYFLEIGIGTPPQMFQMQIDTGSTDAVVYGSDCDGCPQGATVYNPDKSSTAFVQSCVDGDVNCLKCTHMQQCGFELQYGDGSTIDGVVYEDKFTLGKISVRNYLGAIDSINVKSWEPTGTDGIIGLAYQSISEWGTSGFWGALRGKEQFYDAFCLCLYEDSGVWGIGADFSTDKRVTAWTPITDKEWYGINMADIMVNGKSIGISRSVLNANKVIVDSGTTLMIFSTTIMKAIQAQFEALCSQGVNLVGVCNVQQGQSLFDNQCFQMTPAQVGVFPVFTVSLPGAPNLPIAPAQYLWQGAGQAGYYCLGMAAQDDVPVILGDTFMQAYNVIFDRKQSKIGFGPLSTCPSPNM